MQLQRAILVNGSRLMRDFIKRVIEKHAGFQVIKELDDPQELASAIEGLDLEWVFFILSTDQIIPEHQKLDMLVAHPKLRMVILRMNENHIEMEWLARGHKNLTEMSLDELTHILRKELDTLQNMDEDDKKE